MTHIFHAVIYGDIKNSEKMHKIPIFLSFFASYCLWTVVLLALLIYLDKCVYKSLYCKLPGGLNLEYPGENTDRFWDR